jgi:cytochrome c-type biogenesis protein CcmH/NrfG
VAGLFAVPFWLSARDTEQSARALPDDPALALEEAAMARSLNPLAVEPLLAEAEAREALGDPDGAATALRRAIALEPQNYEPWLFYGTFLAFTWERTDEGRAALEQARRLSGDEPSVLTVLESLPPDVSPDAE